LQRQIHNAEQKQKHAIVGEVQTSLLKGMFAIQSQARLWLHTSIQGVPHFGKHGVDCALKALLGHFRTLETWVNFFKNNIFHL
jgi:hypothetical protein